MERIEQMLRDELRRTDAVKPATRDVMLARVTKARRQRAAAVAGFAALAVGTAATAVTLGLGDAGRSGARPGGDGVPPPQYSLRLTGVLFTDHDHGYVVQERCTISFPEGTGAPEGGPTPRTDTECRSHLLATADAGRSWQVRPLPTEPPGKDAGDIEFSGRSILLWTPGAGVVAVGGPDRRYWTSDDGARTWRESDTARPVGPPASVGVVGPDGKPTFLATFPPGGRDAVGPKNPLVGATDGSFWVSCRDAACVRVTRDRGQTWQTVPVRDTVLSVDWVATVDGRTVYAGVRDRAGPRVLRSTDAGATWTEAARLDGADADGNPIPAERGALGCALDGGDLVVVLAGGGGTYRLPAGATTVRKVTGAPDHAGVLYTTGGWLVATHVHATGDRPDLGSVGSLSPDNGRTWQAIQPPPA